MHFLSNFSGSVIFKLHIISGRKKQNILSDGARENSRDGQQDASKLPSLKLCKGKQIRKKKLLTTQLLDAAETEG